MDSHSPFDSYAQYYDTHFESNPITKKIRATVQHTMVHYFRNGNSILELNCGTGTDALFLARNGMKVHATDASEGMIQKTNEKISQENLSEFISTQQLSFENILSLSPMIYDGVLSNFGGLNCAADIRTTMKNIATLIQPQGYFILNILNKFCLWETLAFLLKGKIHDAFRRVQSNGTDANVFGKTIRTHYYFANDIVRMSSREFFCREIYGLNFISPNTNAMGFYERHPALCSTLLQWEEERRHTFPLYNFSDHVVIVLQKQ